jgi:hypothetical protein
VPREPAHDPSDALAAADEALVAALRVGDAESALAWARTRNLILEKLANLAGAGIESARRRLAGARSANDAYLRAARAEREHVATELAAARAQQRVREQVAPASREDPRFVSRRA